MFLTLKCNYINFNKIKTALPYSFDLKIIFLEASETRKIKTKYLLYNDNNEVLWLWSFHFIGEVTSILEVVPL